MPDYLPRRDGDRVNFTANLATRLATDPSAWGLSLSEVENYVLEQAKLASLYRDATSAGTRTPAVLLLKDQALEAVILTTRSLIGRLRASPAISEEALSLLGVRRRAPKRRRVPTPSTTAELTLVAVVGATVTIRAYEAGSFERRARPRDVTGLQVMHWCGPTPPPVEATKWGRPLGSGKTTFTLDFGAGVPAGTEVFALARWLNGRGETGPWGRVLVARLNYSTPTPGPRQVSGHRYHSPSDFALDEEVRPVAQVAELADALL